MDDIDHQVVRDEVLLNALVAVRKPTGPMATGKCLHCETPLTEEGRRWCDADCRTDWEKTPARHR